MRKAALLFLFPLLIAVSLSANAQSSTSASQSSVPAATSNAGTAASPAGTSSGMGTAPAGTAGSSGTSSPAGATTSASDSSGAAMTGVTSRPPAASLDQIVPNTLLHATLDTPLSSKTAKPGDRFTATVSEPIRGSNGMVVIPAGSRIEGEVADSEEGEAARALAAMKDRGKLSLRFRDVLLPTGESLALSAHLVSLNSTNGLTTRRTEDESRGRAGVAVGSQPGSGAPFGPPLKGLAVGNLAGGGYVIATRDKEKTFSLPAQTGMVIRVDEPATPAGDR